MDHYDSESWLATIGRRVPSSSSSSTVEGMEREREREEEEEEEVVSSSYSSTSTWEFKQTVRRHAAELEVKLKGIGKHVGEKEESTRMLVTKIKNNVVKLIEKLLLVGEEEVDQLKRMQLQTLEEFAKILESKEKLIEEDEQQRLKAKKLIRISQKLLYLNTKPKAKVKVKVKAKGKRKEMKL